MARKKSKRFSATKAVKSAAREAIGSPPPSRVLTVEKKKVVEKHKPTLGRLLDEN